MSETFELVNASKGELREMQTKLADQMDTIAKQLTIVEAAFSLKLKEEKRAARGSQTSFNVKVKAA